MSTQVRSRGSANRKPTFNAKQIECLKVIEAIRPNWDEEKRKQICENNSWDMAKINEAVAELMEGTLRTCAPFLFPLHH